MGTSIWSEVIDTFLNKKDFANGSPLYFDLRNANSKRYDIIQNNIANQTKNVYNKLKGLSGDEVSRLISTLISKRDESINKENELLSSYSKKKEYKKMTDDERIELATKVYLGLEKGTQETGAIIEKNPIIYLGYFFKSNELYNDLKAKGAGELLSRGVITGEQQKDAFINQKTIENLSEIFGNFLQESADILREDMYKEVEEDIKTMLSNIQGIFTSDLNNFNPKSQRLAKTYSSSTRNTIRNFLDTYNQEPKHSLKLEGIIVYRDGETIKIDIIPLGKDANTNINRQNTLLAVFSSEASKGKNNWYLAFRNNKNADKIILTFSLLVFKALNNCSNNVFNVNNIGEIKIDNDIKKAMQRKLTPTHIRQFIDVAGNNLNKFFNPANSNAFLSGFLGELGNYYIIKGKQDNLNLMISGSAYDEIGSGNLKSQSTSDLTVKDKSGKNNLYGFNIKNYISMSNNKTITLYKSDNGLDIFNGFISKYFTDEEVILARFLVLNAGQNKIGSKNIKLSIGSTALKNLPNFLRITDANKSITNLFFILNNICYPTSYIYNQLIEDLRNCGRKRESQIDNFFTFSYQNTELPIYENEGDAERYMEKDNNNNIIAKSLQDASYINKYKPNNSFYIQFKGLKVNLMSFIK